MQGHTNWFVSEEAAEKHAAWIESQGGKVHRITHYRITG